MAVVTPSIAEIFEEAYDRAGLEMRSGYDLRSARRSLNFLLLEWQNRGLNLFMIEQGTTALTAGTAEYTMPSDTIDLIEHQLRSGSGTNQLDSTLDRISVSTYAQQSLKNTRARPTQIYVSRQSTGVTATLWPVPDSSSYTLLYYRLVGADGLANGVGTTPDIPPRFVPCLTAGLAHQLAMKRPQSNNLVPMLKSEYEQQFRMAADEDRERASWFLVPEGFRR